MKAIPLLQAETMSAKDVYTLVTGASPQKPLSVAEMRLRVRILDAIEAATPGGTLLLEDAEHAVLAEAIEHFPWSQASSTLLQIIDNVLQAPPAPQVPRLKEVN